MTHQSLEMIGLEINLSKSATNASECRDFMTSLEDYKTYRSLESEEGPDGRNYDNDSLEKLENTSLSRLNLLCETKLNAKNLITAINEYS